MNAITAKLGIDIAPLKKGADDAAAIAKATSKQIADDQKKRVKEAEEMWKGSLKAKADAEAKALEIVKRAAAKDAEIRKEAAHKAGAIAGTLSTGLASAGSAGDLLGTGFAALGDIAGPAAAAVASVGLIAKGMWDAAEGARQTIRELGELRESTHNTTGANSSRDALIGKAAEISKRFEADRKAKAEEQAKLGKHLGPLVENTVQNGLFGSTMEKLNNIFKTTSKGGATVGTIAALVNPMTAPMGVAAAIGFGVQHGKPTAMDQKLKQEAALSEEHARLLDEAIEPQREDLAIADNREHVGERQAALDESRLRTLREVAQVEAAMAGSSQADMDKLTEGIKTRGKLEKEIIDRKAKEIARDRADSLENEKAQAAAAATGFISPRAGALMNIERLRKEEEKKRKYADRSGIQEEARNQLLADADALKIQADAAAANLRMVSDLMTPADRKSERAGTRFRRRKIQAGEAREADRINRAERNGGKTHGSDYFDRFTAASGGRVGPRPDGTGKALTAADIATAFDNSIVGQALRNGIQIVNQ